MSGLPGYHIEDNEVRFCDNNEACEIPAERHFADDGIAESYLEKTNTIPFPKFILDKRIRDKYRNVRRSRAGEPPLIRGGSIYHDDKKFNTLTEAGFVDDDESPNMRLFDNPDARYVGAQARSARVSGNHHPEIVVSGESDYPIRHQAVIDGVQAVVNVGYRHKLHDINYPAYEDGESVVFYEEGVVHRDPDQGPAVSIKDGRTKAYVFHGLLHNPNGPAVITDTMIAYYQNGLLHNPNFPTVVYSNGRREYWEKGKHIRTVKAAKAEASESIISRTRLAYNVVSPEEAYETAKLSII